MTNYLIGEIQYIAQSSSVEEFLGWLSTLDVRLRTSELLRGQAHVKFGGRCYARNSKGREPEPPFNCRVCLVRATWRMRTAIHHSELLRAFFFSYVVGPKVEP